MASIQRLIDDLVVGIRNRTEKRSAMCRRLTPQTTARSQANRITLWLICREVETPLISGVKYLRCFWPSREDPCATMNRYRIGDTVAEILNSIWTGQMIAFILPVQTFFPRRVKYARTGCIRVRPHREDCRRQG